jgi:hypothetical protein
MPSVRFGKLKVAVAQWTTPLFSLVLGAQKFSGANSFLPKLSDKDALQPFWLRMVRPAT